jgi:hypothetical protein
LPALSIRASAAGAASTAGPVFRPCEMKSRRVTGAL